MYPLPKSYRSEFRHFRKYKSVYWCLSGLISLNGFVCAYFSLPYLHLLARECEQLLAAAVRISRPEAFPYKTELHAFHAGRVSRSRFRATAQSSHASTVRYRGYLWARMFLTRLLTYQYSIEEHTGIVEIPFVVCTSCTDVRVYLWYLVCLAFWDRSSGTARLTTAGWRCSTEPFLYSAVEGRAFGPEKSDWRNSWPIHIQLRL